MARPEREIRAEFDRDTITVYQAFSDLIAGPAITAQTFVPPFKVERMTWVKPSFLWTMHRSGWARKPNQERILAVRITREGFEWALRHSCLSHSSKAISRGEWRKVLQAVPVRVQWDPERSPRLERLAYRSIQVGLSGEAVHRYINSWIVAIEDRTALARQAEAHVESEQISALLALLPAEAPYPVPADVAKKLGMNASITPP